MSQKNINNLSYILKKNTNYIFLMFKKVKKLKKRIRLNSITNDSIIFLSPKIPKIILFLLLPLFSSFSLLFFFLFFHSSTLIQFTLILLDNFNPRFLFPHLSSTVELYKFEFVLLDFDLFLVCLDKISYCLCFRWTAESCDLRVFEVRSWSFFSLFIWILLNFFVLFVFCSFQCC